MVLRSLFVWLLVALLVGCSDDADNSASGGNSHQTGGDPMSDKIVIVDDYLVKWDRFAQGDNGLMPYIRENTPNFERLLSQLLQAGDRRAPARLVFYPVVQVGGSVPVDSDLGKAALSVLGDDFPVTTTDDGKRVLFSGDLYFWWEEHKNEYERLPVFDEWQASEFAQQTVLPMYRSIRNRGQ